MKTFKIEIGNQQHEIQAQVDESGKCWVAVRPLCDLLGIDPFRQQKKIESSGRVMHQHMLAHDTVDRNQKMLCVNIEHVAAWLFGINPNKVRADIKQQLIMFQDKLQLVLYTAVFGNYAVETLQKEVVELRQTVRSLSNTIMVLVDDNKALRDQVRHQNDLNRDYIDKRLSSVGGKLLSSMRHKKHKEEELH